MPEAQEALKEDNIMVDLDVTGKSVDVELKDAKEEKEQPEIEVKEEPVKEEKKDEREEYSDGVKKRIDRLTYKIREAERREKEALSFAEQVKKERDVRALRKVRSFPKPPPSDLLVMTPRT